MDSLRRLTRVNGLVGKSEMVNGVLLLFTKGLDFLAEFVFLFLVGLFVLHMKKFY